MSCFNCCFGKNKNEQSARDDRITNSEQSVEVDVLEETYSTVVYNEIYAHVLQIDTITDVTDEVTALAISIASHVKSIYLEVYTKLCRANTTHLNAILAARSVPDVFLTALDIAKKRNFLVKKACSCATDVLNNARIVWDIIYAFFLDASKAHESTDKFDPIVASDEATFVSGVFGEFYAIVLPSGTSLINARILTATIADVYCTAFTASQKKGIKVVDACNIARGAIRVATISSREFFCSVFAAAEPDSVRDEASIKDICNTAACDVALCGALYATVCASGASEAKATIAANRLAEVYSNTFNVVRSTGVSVENACNAALLAFRGANEVCHVVYSYAFAASNSHGVLDDATVNTACNAAAYIGRVYAEIYADAYAFGTLARYALIVQQRVVDIFLNVFHAFQDKGASAQEVCNAALNIVDDANAVSRVVFGYVISDAKAYGVSDNSIIDMIFDDATSVSCAYATSVSCAYANIYTDIYASGISLVNAGIAACSIVDVHRTTFRVDESFEAVVMRCEKACTVVNVVKLVYREIYLHVFRASVANNVAHVAATIVAYYAATITSHVANTFYATMHSHIRKYYDSAASWTTGGYCIAFDVSLEKGFKVAAACNIARSAVCPVFIACRNIYYTVLEKTRKIKFCWETVTPINHHLYQVYANVLASGGSDAKATNELNWLAEVYMDTFENSVYTATSVETACDAARDAILEPVNVPVKFS